VARKIALVVVKRGLHDDNDVKYWRSRPLAERIGAVTELRMALWDLDGDGDGARLEAGE